MSAVDVTPNQCGSVLKEILTPGEGDETPPPGCVVRVHYHGTLTDGTVFDSSVERGEPFQFNLGKGEVIKAWDIGVATMKKGEKARLTCKPAVAYGKRGSPPKIPGNATLIFDVTVLSWQDEDITPNKDGGVCRATLQAGESFANPAEFSLCQIHLKGLHDGRVFDDRELSFNVGEGSEVGVPSGVEIGLLKMQKGEKARLTLSPQYGFPEGNSEKNIPAGASLIYEVLLKEFEKRKISWDMDPAERLAEAALFKNRATEYFQKSKFSVASKLYAKAATYIEAPKGVDDSQNRPVSDIFSGFSEEEEKERKKALLAIKLNLALVHLKLKDPYETKTKCDQALNLDPDNVKGLFRRGQAYLLLSEPELAKADFERVVKLEPSNNAAIAQINICKQMMRDFKEKEKKTYRNMFEKFAIKDKEDNSLFGWWDDAKKQPLITDIIPEDKADLEEIKREKRKQLENLKRIAEQKKKAKEEEERIAKEEAEKKKIENSEEASAETVEGKDTESANLDIKKEEENAEIVAESKF